MAADCAECGRAARHKPGCPALARIMARAAPGGPTDAEATAAGADAYRAVVAAGREPGGAACTPAYDRATDAMRAKWPHATGRQVSRACRAALEEIYRLAGF